MQLLICRVKTCKLLSFTLIGLPGCYQTWAGQYIWINWDWSLGCKKVLPAVAQQLKTVAVQFICALPNANIPLNSLGFIVVLQQCQLSRVHSAGQCSEHSADFMCSAESCLCTLHGGDCFCGDSHGSALQASRCGG